MTLPASFPLSMSQIATELGLSLPLSMNHAWVLALAQKTVLPVSFSDLLGKTAQWTGDLFVNGSGIGSWSPTPQFFDQQLYQLLGGPTVVAVHVTNSLAYFGGNIKITNNTTGGTCVLTHQIGVNYVNNSPPSNVVRPGFTDNFTILPSS